MKLLEIKNRVVLAYHRTFKKASAQSIVKNGFDTKINRPEIYLTGSWESANSLDGSTGADYGSYLIRCKIDTSGFPKTGHKEKGGDGDIIVVKDPSIITDIEFTLLDIDDPKYWINGEVGTKFIKNFPKPEDFVWTKK